MQLKPTLANIDALEALAISLVPPATVDAPVAGPALTDAQKKAKRVGALIKAHFADGHHKALTHVIGALMEVEPNDFGITVAAAGSPKLSKGAALVPVGNSNSHNYRLGRVMFAMENRDNCVVGFQRGRRDALAIEQGDNLYRPPHTNTRFATAEEIKAELAEWRNMAVAPAAGIGF